MHVTILGSGTNVHPRRAGAGYLVKTDHLLLLDFGPRTLTNMIRGGLDRHRIRHILFSHYHADHFSDFIPFFFDAVYHSRFVGPRPDLAVYGPRGTAKLFGAMLDAFPGFRDGRFRLSLHDLDDRGFTLGATRITPRTVAHSARLHCLGYRLEYRGKAMAYSGDSAYCRNLVRLCGDADVAIVDCSFPANRPGPNHMHAGDCGRVAKEAAVRRLVLSHFYPVADRYDVKRQAGEAFAGRITKGRDLLELVL